MSTETSTKPHGAETIVKWNCPMCFRPNQTDTIWAAPVQGTNGKPGAVGQCGGCKRLFCIECPQ